MDTSVVSACLDSRWPERQTLTRRFWAEALPDFDAYISETTVQELSRTPDSRRREGLLAMVAALPILRLTREAAKLAGSFIEEGLVPRVKQQDARHLAIAVVEGIDILASWNFDDMVNLHTKRLMPMPCAKHGYFK